MTRARFARIATGAGEMGTFIALPDAGPARATVVMLMDGRGMREALRDHARRLAQAGYAVLLPNLYYRTFPPGEAGEIVEEPTLETMRAHALPLTRAAAADDVRACLDYAAAELPPTTSGKVGLIGFCMGGRLAVGVAHELGAAVAAVSSLHPGSMATRQPESPHLFLGGITAEIYFGVPEHDDYLSAGAVARLRAALDAAGVDYAMEVLPGAHHGYSTPGNATYSPADAEHAWAKTLDLFDRRL